ncbi:MAG TPA: hypothetical protein VKV22_05505 [Rhodanobacteraceae bacterium]|nr:hypothetical protein [Rhodanobacteraceae bacterium]
MQRNGEGDRTIKVTETTTDVHVLTFKKSSMLRTDEKIGLNEKSAGNPVDEVLASEARRKAGARRTAWIIAAIAAAFFIASLVHGHLVGISNWVPPGH